MNLSHWFNGGNYIPGASGDSWWWITITLSLSITAGYTVIAFNWYFQSKLRRQAEATAALIRLRNISFSCAACGFAFFVLDIPWIVWRMYDGVLILLALYTWSFLIKMRGLSLLDERLAQLDELERRARKYREIAELLPHMVWTATADGYVDFCNRKWRQYVDGDERTWLQAVHPDEREHALARWQEALLSRRPLSLELRLGGSGGYRTFLVKATPIVQGDAVKWLGACADIEDQKLLAAQQELQARQKSFFLNALSHDLRAPLHNVLLNAQLLKMTARDEADAESVQMIVENAVAAGDLITRLLEFAKAGAQDHNTIEPVYVQAILHQIVRRFLPLAEQKGLALRVDGAGDPNLLIQSDRQKIERIVSNLVENAIKYTERGSVTLSMRYSAPATVGEARQVTLRIADSGPGIPPANVSYLFNEFYQVNNHERDRTKGFGMGLAICKCLARHLGGDVRLASTSGAGSCFELLLSDLRADRGGRPGGAESDLRDPQGAGLCGV
jgi:PAS domain S-box-containing protein